MGAYTTLAVNEESYNRIVSLIRTGYTGKGNVIHRPAPHMACCLVIQANLGCRIGDILHLSLSSLVRDGDHYRMDIVEEKTGKARRHQVPEPVYNYIRDYCEENRINPERRIFQFTERAVQKALKSAREYLDIPRPQHIASESLPASRSIKTPAMILKQQGNFSNMPAL